jgi:CHAT domain-containing protein
LQYYFVWYSPSGLLNRISLPAVAMNDTQRLCDRYQLNCLSSSRSLIGSDKNFAALAAKDTMALFGGINYECEATQLQRLVEQSGGAYIAMRSSWIPEDPARGSVFTYLPGTLKEVTAVAQIGQQRGKNVLLYTSDDATEAAFKSLNGTNSPSVIHVATHGFFFDDPKKDYTSRMRMDLGTQLVRAYEDPLLRSGLILAGGNRAWRGDTIPAGMENGILF